MTKDCKETSNISPISVGEIFWGRVGEIKEKEEFQLSLNRFLALAPLESIYSCSLSFVK